MIFEILITLLLVFLNGFFVAAEFAIVKVRASQIELFARTGNRVAYFLNDVMKNLDGYLAATQLGITLASLALGWVGEEVVAKIVLTTMQSMEFDTTLNTAHAIAIPIAFFLITVLHIVFGELIPKSIAIQYAFKTSVFVSFPLRVFYIVFKPFIFSLNGFANLILKLSGISLKHDDNHSTDELKYLIKKGNESGTIENTNYDIINNAVDFSEKSVRQILIPRTDVIALDINRVTEDVLNKLIDEGYSRIPCYKGNLDTIVGIIYLRDILIMLKRPHKSHISTLLRPIIFVPESKKLGPLLKELQKKHIHLAVVVNEFGGVEGIVTMEDIIEELIGDIQDESDEESSIVEKDKGTFKITATASIRDINKFLPQSIEEDKRYDTLAGAIISHAERMPNVNEKICFDGYEFTVLKRLRNRISLVRARELTKIERSL
jgi:CBS domain containing-hemolysin-like protein